MGIPINLTHSQCEARPEVTISASERHRPLVGTKSNYILSDAVNMTTVNNILHRHGHTRNHYRMQSALRQSPIDTADGNDAMCSEVTQGHCTPACLTGGIMHDEANSLTPHTHSAVLLE